LREGTTGQLMHIELAPAEEQPMLQPVQLPEMEAHHIDPTTGLDEFEMADAAIAQAGRRAPGQIDRREPAVTRKATDGGVDPKQPSTWGKVSRNALCPCGSGKKYKHCHGKHD
jgi:preprotein translocase subunit SecA